METEPQSKPQDNSHTSTSIDQLLNAAYKLNDWLNFYWHFYVIFVGVIFGWIFNSNSSWSPTQKNLVALLFVFFAGGNVVTLYRSYRAINETGRSLKDRWGVHSRSLKERLGLHSRSLKKKQKLDSLKRGQDPFKEALLAKVSQPLWLVAIFMHLVTDAIVVWSITR
jgi:hypothetical protein